MKKAKQRNLYEEKSDPLGSLDMQLDGDDDDIIELEDIIEMPDRPIDEDEDLDLGVEIFDVDEDLESPPARSGQKPAMSSAKQIRREAEEDDLLDSFEVDADEEDLLFEPAQPAPRGKPAALKGQPSQLFDEDDLLFDEPTQPASKGKPAAQKGQPAQLFDEEDESNDDTILDQSFLDDLLAGAAEAEPPPREEKMDLRARAAAAALKVAEEKQPPEAVAAAGKSEALVSVAGPSISEISEAAEELIGRIESRLQEHIRAVVESMLPGLVRSIIDEEIEKLKKEFE